jgi:hypothetical protein
MNEIERIIAGAAVNGPSERLDRRIGELLAAHPAPEPRRSPRRREAPVLCSTAAAVGILGFILGRASVDHPTVSAPPDRAPEVAVEPPHEVDRVVRVSLTDRQLSDFFAAPAGREGAFGNGAAFSSNTLSQPQ